MTRKAILFLGAAAAIVLSGCGIRGDLERPPPIWGPDNRTPSERAHETDETRAEEPADPSATR